MRYFTPNIFFWYCTIRSFVSIIAKFEWEKICIFRNKNNLSSLFNTKPKFYVVLSAYAIRTLWKNCRKWR